MSKIKSRSIRLDDENWEWLSKLPGRSQNEAVTGLREARENVEVSDGFSRHQTEVLDEMLELVRSLPDAKEIEEAVLRAIGRWKGIQSIPAPTVSMETSGPFVPKGGLEPADEPSEGRQKCRHCGTENAIPADARANRPCPPCFKRGHKPFEPCGECVKDQYQKEMEAKHGTEGVDYTVDWGA